MVKRKKVKGKKAIKKSRRQGGRAPSGKDKTSKVRKLMRLARLSKAAKMRKTSRKRK